MKFAGASFPFTKCEGTQRSESQLVRKQDKPVAFGYYLVNQQILKTSHWYSVETSLCSSKFIFSKYLVEITHRGGSAVKNLVLCCFLMLLISNFTHAEK